MNGYSKIRRKDLLGGKTYLVKVGEELLELTWDLVGLTFLANDGVAVHVKPRAAIYQKTPKVKFKPKKDKTVGGFSGDDDWLIGELIGHLQEFEDKHGPKLIVRFDAGHNNVDASIILLKEDQ